MLKVMIVENDLLMADMLDEILVDGGFQVCGIARRVDEAVALDVRSKPDITLLDLRLIGRELGTELVPRLDRTRGMGILYVTGNGRQISLTTNDGEACLDKPYRPADVVRAVNIVDELVKTGKATGPFPHGFRLLEPPGDVPVETPPQDDLPLRDLENARLLRRQAALAAFGGFALRQGDLQTVLSEAARICAEVMGVPFCKVCRYRAKEDDLFIVAGVGWKPGVVGRVARQADMRSPQGRAFLTGEPVISPDLRLDTRFTPTSIHADHGVVSTLAVVIKTKEGQNWGVLEIDNLEHHEFNQYDVDVCASFANIVAEAVNNAARDAVALGSLVQIREMATERDRLLGLQTRLLAERVVLTHEFQHRVRDNLQFVNAMLNMQIESADGANGADSLAAISRRVMTLAKVYDHLLGAELGRTIDFGSCLQSLCDTFHAMESQDRDIRLSCTAQSLILGLDSATALGLVVAELISNCYRHAFPDDQGTIDVSLVVTDDGARLTLADDGVGYQQGGASRRSGLALVSRLMEQVNGAAEVVSDHGTLWTLTFGGPALPAKPLAAVAI